MSRHRSRRSAVRLFPYPARSLARSPAWGYEPPGTALAVEGSLALAPVHPPSTGPPRRPRLRPMGTAGTSPGARVAPRSVRGQGAGPDADLATAAQVIIMISLEAFAGSRPFHHLSRWVTLDVWEELSGHRTCVPTAGRVSPPRVLTSWIQLSTQDEAEVGAVAQVGARVQTIAFRLERFRGRWRCRALETTIPPR